MSKNHKSRGQSSTVSRSKERQSFRRSSQTPEDTFPEPRSAGPFRMASDISSTDQLWTPIALQQPSVRQEGSSLQSTSYFMPMSQNVAPFKLAFFPPLPKNILSTPQTLSVMLPDVTASTSKHHASGSSPIKQDMHTSHPTPFPHSDSLRRAAPTTPSSQNEKFVTPVSSPYRSLTDSPSPQTRHVKASVNFRGLSSRLAASPTPGPGRKSSSRPAPHSQENDDDEDADNLPSSHAPEPAETSYFGRLSDKVAEELAEGLTELDNVAKKIKASTGLSIKQIIRRWQPPNSRDLNFWNIYQKYFHRKTEEELKRLHLKDRPARGTKADVKTIRAAYKAFQKDEPNHESILEVFWRIHEIDGSNTTVNGRSRDFLKYFNALKRLAESASTIHGFEVAFCAVGSVVHQDQSLSATFCSRMVPEFFSERLRLSDNEIEGHLKAYAYDNTSRMALIDEDRDDITPAQPIVAQLPSTAVPGGVGDEVVKIKGESRRLLAILKNKFVNLLADRRGPARRVSSNSTAPKESTASQLIKKRSGKSREGEGVEYMPPTKRRKGNR